ncbi:MAG TPA: hypothetical protein VF834_13955 [Streptosporangiaceae bacterium]
MQILGGSAIAAILVLLAALVFLLPKPAHVVTDPATLGSYIKQSALASTTADQMKQKIVAGAPGEVKNVVAAVYERKTGPGTSNGPQIIAFVGGNLAGGASASGLIGAMTAMRGSFTTNAGSLGGQAVCAPGASGGPAECTWADNDTFGVLISATMSASALAEQMRVIRPLVEHVAH